MKKSGLHKQIACIFDGGSDTPAGMAVLETEPADGSAQTPIQPESPAIAPAATGMIAPEASAQEPCSKTPALTRRPMPVCRHNVGTAKSASMVTQLKKAAGRGSSLDPRQKKMAIMVGALAIVFATVLFISLGGTGQSQVPTSKKESQIEPPAVKADVKSAWKTPEPLPETMRDPMKPAPVAALKTETTGANPTAQMEMTVKGIVFSQTKPTALINNEIVKEGQVINGVTIVKIDRNQVEFESNGNRWTQSVQR
ncbi:MAG: hypothetical protein LLF76_05165 [Planctomycetaceae bacterium]|nr:hypothetical protein [Planctomycetaceae bacterium]